MGGRSDELNVRRGLALLRALWEAGVPFLAQAAHLGSPDDFRRVIEMATSGVRVGAAADLVVLDAADPVTALLDRAPRRYVIKNGRVVAETVRSVVHHRRSGT